MKRAAKRKNAPKWRIRQRVRKALKKYVRKGNPRAGSKPYWIAYRDDMYGEYMTAKVRSADDERNYGRVIARSYKKSAVSKAATIANRRHEGGFTNPSRVKGRKVKGGRAVTLRNFTGTVVRKANGVVQIVGKGRKR